jgi:kinetochore protein NDC80
LSYSLESKFEDLKTGPSAIETLERNKAELANDVSKFHSIVNNFSSKKEDLERCLGERKQELEAKNSEFERLTKENESLKQQIESQHVNIWDYEKMSRECHAIELDIQAAQASRNEWEEKAWDVEVSASKKLKELEAAIDRYNQEIIRYSGPFGFMLLLHSRVNCIVHFNSKWWHGKGEP